MAWGHAAALRFPCPLVKPDVRISKRPALPQTSRQARRGGWRALDAARHAELSEDCAPEKRARSPSSLLMLFGRKAPDAAILPDRG